MDKTTLLEILDAAHLTKHIHSPLKQRGGIMLIGPPATLKTTFISSVFSEHCDALVLGDINIQTLMALRDDLRTGRYSTFAFTEFEKLYQRRSDTAANIEGSIKMLVEEGFHKASFEDQRMSMSTARCLVVGAMTTSFYEKHFRDWNDSGFLRRFLWCNITIVNGYKLTDALAQWQLLDFGTYKSRTPGNKSIPYADSEDENRKIQKWLKEQPGEHTPLVLMKKILSVLKWKYEKAEPGKALKILFDFSESLRKQGAEIAL